MTDVRSFEDRSDRMFGRERDLDRLQGRVRFKGLTAVVGRPQMGKSWLLEEFARRLAHEHNPLYAVGFAESFGQTPDLLARAVSDLYIRWPSDAGMAEQARMVWEEQGKSLLDTWFIENRPNTIRPEAEALVIAFASAGACTHVAW